MTPALVVMIATHDSVLITQSAGRVGKVKQRQYIVRRIGLCQEIASAHIQLPMAMHIFTRRVALMCTGLLSSLAKCPGTVCPRNRSPHKADTRKNEDGNVTRNICVSSIVCLPKVLLCKIADTSFARFEQNDHIIARRIRRHVRNLQVGSQFRFNFPVHITNIFVERSRGAFRGGVVPAFLHEQLHADATYHSRPARNRS